MDGTRALTPAEALHGVYIDTPVRCHNGKVWINPTLLGRLATGENLLVIEGDTREGLVAAGWARIVSDLFLAGTDAFASAYLDAHRTQRPAA